MTQKRNGGWKPNPKAKPFYPSQFSVGVLDRQEKQGKESRKHIEKQGKESRKHIEKQVEKVEKRLEKEIKKKEGELKKLKAYQETVKKGK